MHYTPSQPFWVFLDDDEDDRYLMETVAAQQSVSVVTTEEPRQFFNTLSLYKSSVLPSLLIVDYNLKSGLNGLDVLRLLKESDEYTDLPIVIFSTGVTKEDCKSIVAQGAADCIQKPTLWSELEKTVAKLKERFYPHYES